MHPRNIDFCTRLAKGIAEQFGSRCEVVVHDLQSADPEHTVIAIENGQVSGGKLGDGPSRVVIEALHADPAKLQDRLAYLAKTEDGKILKSSTVFMRDDDGKPVGAFTINYDITLMLAMEDSLHEMSAASADTAREPETVTRNVTGLLDELIEHSVRLVGKPVALMTREDKVRAIGFLNESGAFLVTKAGQKVCKYFGISKYTLYSYIDEANKDES